MRITIDTKEKTIEINEWVNIQVFNSWLKKHLKDHKKYSIKSNNYWSYYPTNTTTLTINDTSPIYTYTQFHSNHSSTNSTSHE